MTAIKTHSKLGASSSERWFECPGSVALCDLVPKKPDTEWSKEGTNAHTFMEFMLKRPGVTGPSALPNARHYLGKEKEIKLDFKLTPEMADYVQDFVDRVLWQYHQMPGAIMHVEKKFHLKHIHPDLYGTSDVVLVQPFGKIYVIDFKYGAGVAVDVIENSQLLYYGLGASFGEDFGEIILVIAQPRIDGGEWQEWETTPEYMLEFSKTLKQKALATQKKNAPLQEGEWCRWCDASGICPQLQKKAVVAAQTDFTEEGAKLPEVTKMTDEQVVRVIEFEKTITSWIGAVKEAAFLRLMSGEKIEGLKLVRGKGSREWQDEDEVLKVFGKDVMTAPKLMTPSAAEKALGKKAVGEFILSIQGGIQIAAASDKRAEVKNAQDDFEKIEAPKPKFSEDDF
jgi:hypothetical protein